MIFTPHILVGTVIGTKTQDLGLIILLGIAIHILLDKLPHWEYAVETDLRNFHKTKKIKYFIRPFIKASIDFLSGLLIVFFIILQNNLFYLLPYIMVAIFFSLLPDILGGSMFLFAKDKFIEKYIKIFIKYFHIKNKEEDNKITFLNITTQILVVIICVFLLYL
ncbi:hypothetical protein KJ684_00820 [Patescibacteria group bacterium]|nr:hypothetical protein [Patescibacteria group bacterium]